MNDLMLIKMIKAMNQLTHNANGLILNQIFLFLQVSVHIAIVTELHNQVVVVAGLLHVVEFYDVWALTAL
jgi:hypothetical protein